MKKRKHKIKLETIQYQLLYVAMDSHYTKIFDHIAMTDLLKSSIPSINIGLSNYCQQCTSKFLLLNSDK